jgi:hypothetical protein
MHKLVTAITDWPPILQAVVGAGLFWLLITLATWLYSLCSGRVARFSQHRRLTRLKDEWFRCSAFKSGQVNNIETSGIHAAVLWFRASRQLIKGLIWLTLGLLAHSIPAFSEVGFAGSLFYLFAAFQVVRPYTGPTAPAEVDRQLERLAREIAELHAQLGNNA